MRITVLEGADILPAPPGGRVDSSDAALGKHFLFLGAVGSGKTNAIKLLVHKLRAEGRPGDVFVFFDTKGDYQRAFRRAGDAVVGPGGKQVWNVFADLPPKDDPELEDHLHEIAATIFGQLTGSAAQNAYFAYAARDVFGAVLLAMRRSVANPSNAELCAQLGCSAADLSELLLAHEDLAAAAVNLEGSGGQGVLAFLRQATSAAFGGQFRERGDFSVRSFVRDKGSRALFVEYDLAIGARLLPVYRVLINIALKEALEIGRAALSHGPVTGRVFFVLDEFALMPALSHLGDGVNFGRELGLRFIAGTQNVHQVFSSYGPDAGRSILSGFGTVVALRLLDAASRDLVRQRYGMNRKQFQVSAPVRNNPDHQVVITGSVIEDWELSELRRGECVVAPHEGPPFKYAFSKADLAWAQLRTGQPRWADLHVRLRLVSDQVRADHQGCVVGPGMDARVHLRRGRAQHRQDEGRDHRERALEGCPRPAPPRFLGALVRVFILAQVALEAGSEGADVGFQRSDPAIRLVVQLWLQPARMLLRHAVDGFAGGHDQPGRVRGHVVRGQGAPGEHVGEHRVKDTSIILASRQRLRHPRGPITQARMLPVLAGQPVREQVTRLGAGLREQSVLGGTR